MEIDMLSLEKETEFRKRINRLGWTLTIMIGAINILAIVDVFLVSMFSMLGSEKLTIASGAIFDTICYLGYFLIPAAFFYLMSKNKPAESVKFKLRVSKYLPLMILSGVGLCHAAGILNDWFCQAIDYSLPADDYSRYMTNPEIVAMFMTVSLAPAFAEELLFRGVVYTNLRPYGKTFAILTNALMFSLMHQNVGQLFYTFAAGVVMALIYEASGSIWGSILLHMFNNLYAVLQTAIMYRYDEATASVILYLSQSVLIFLGAVSTVCLLCVKRKHDRLVAEGQEGQPPAGVFGKNRKENLIAYDAPVPVGRAFRMLFKAPGMMFYMIASVVLTLMAVAMYGGGGYAA